MEMLCCIHCGNNCKKCQDYCQNECVFGTSSCIAKEIFDDVYVCEMCKVILFSSVGSIIRMLEIIFADFNCYIKENDIELTKLHQRLVQIEQKLRQQRLK